MTRKVRLMAVAQEILKNPAFKISSLAEKYDVSEMTIRRDLKYLEDQGVLTNGKTPSVPALPPVMMASSSATATRMFISTAGVEKNGLTCFSQYEVITKRTAIQSSLKRYLLTDSSKFGMTKPAFFSSFEEIDEIITDRGLSPEWRKYMEQLDIQLTLVG